MRAIRALVLLLAAAPATTLHAQDDPHASEPDFDRIDREYAESFERGTRAFADGDLLAAVEAYERCHELLPDIPSPVYNLACAHALLGNLDEGVDWFERSVAVGFQYRPGHPEHARTDGDLDALRGDERFEAALARMQELADEAIAYASAPALHVPEGLEGPFPLVVVLHAEGETKDDVVAGRWRTLADELGFALLAPSGTYPTTDRGPAEGMRWFQTVGEFDNDRERLCRPVTELVAATLREHDVDRDLVTVVGEGVSALVAFDLCTRTPGLYRSCLMVDGRLDERLADEAPVAGRRGVRAAILFDESKPLYRFSDRASPGLKVGTLRTWLGWWEIECRVESYAPSTDQNTATFVKGRLTEMLEWLWSADDEES